MQVIYQDSHLLPLVSQLLHQPQVLLLVVAESLDGGQEYDTQQEEQQEVQGSGRTGGSLIPRTHSDCSDFREHRGGGGGDGSQGL